MRCIPQICISPELLSIFHHHDMKLRVFNFLPCLSLKATVNNWHYRVWFGKSLEQSAHLMHPLRECFASLSNWITQSLSSSSLNSLNSPSLSSSFKILIIIISNLLIVFSTDSSSKSSSSSSESSLAVRFLRGYHHNLLPMILFSDSSSPSPHNHLKFPQSEFLIIVIQYFLILYV